jgi:hypothetical protein
MELNLTDDPEKQHRVVRVNDLMYKGCEPHWKCVKCGICIPFHCYKKDEIEKQECSGSSPFKGATK